MEAVCCPDYREPLSYVSTRSKRIEDLTLRSGLASGVSGKLLVLTMSFWKLVNVSNGGPKAVADFLVESHRRFKIRVFLPGEGQH